MLSHFSVCVSSCVSGSRSVTFVALLAGIGMSSHPASAQTQLSPLTNTRPNTQPFHASLSIPDSLIAGAIGDFPSTQWSRNAAPEKPAVTGRIDSASTSRLAVTLKSTISFGLSGTSLVHHHEADTPARFATQKVAPPAVIYQSTFRPAPPRRRTGARRAIGWMLQEAIGDDGIRQLKQGCDMAKRIGFRASAS